MTSEMQFTCHNYIEMYHKVFEQIETLSLSATAKRGKTDRQPTTGF